MNHGKSTCNQLKAIRKQIADANGIAYEPHECTFEGECRGTCPACEGEMRYIERELQRRQGLGKKIAVVGIATGLSAAIATTQQSCSFTSPSDRPINPPDKESSADITMGKILPPPPPRTTQTSQEYVNEHIRMYNGSPMWISSSESGDDYLIEDINIIASPKIVCTPHEKSDLILNILGDISMDDDEIVLQEIEEEREVEEEEREVEEEEREVEEEEDNGLFGYIMEYMPYFPGGDSGFREYLMRNTHYPVSAMERGVQGRVFVTFMVNKEGYVTDVKVARSIDPLLDAEAVRVVKSMPRWEPGKSRDQFINVRYTVPINFIIQ